MKHTSSGIYIVTSVFVFVCMYGHRYYITGDATYINHRS